MKLRTFVSIVGLLTLIIIPLFVGGLIWQKFFGKPKNYINTDRTTVIKEIKKLNRLETASYTMEKIIDAGTSQDNVIKDFLFGDKLLLIAHGQVIAGFDLSQLSEDNIIISDKNLTLTLPPPQILSSRLDNVQTRVYDRRQGILNKGDQNLESEARQAAEKSITEAACAGNILNEAADGGRKQLTTLFQALGFTTVVIEIPTGNCQ